MRNTIIFLVLVLFSSCLTQKRAAKKLNQIANEYPELIQAKADTIIEVWEITKEVFVDADTSELFDRWDDMNTDSIVYEIGDSVFITKVKLIRDTVVNVSIRTEVFADTITVTVRDTIDKIVNKTEFVTKIEDKTPWWVWILIVTLSLSVLILLLRKKQ